MTDELIEQVARALFKLANGDALDPDETWNGQAWWCAFIDDAQAALAAINLPARLEAARTQGWNGAVEAAAKQCELSADKYRLAHENAQARKQRQEARDFESMAMASAFRAFEIRALTKENGDG